MIRVVLPAHLRTLAKIEGELLLEVTVPLTQRCLIDALEKKFPMLRGTMRDHISQQRRSYLRFFACQEDVSHESLDAALPPAVVSGQEPFLIVGSVAGG